MPYNNIHSTITKEKRDAVLAAIEVIESEVGQVINLTPTERRTIPKMGRVFFGFVTKCIWIMKNNPEYVPPYLNPIEIEEDYDASILLGQIEDRLRSTVEKVSDTRMACGSEALIGAQSFYSSVKRAITSRMTGVDTLYQELAAAYPNRSRRKRVPVPSEEQI